MRAGKLDKDIVVQSLTTTTDDYAQTIEVWTELYRLRAEVVMPSTQEFLRSYGPATESTAVFRTRFVEGIAPGMRVEYRSTAYRIVEIKEIGRRRGLELRAVRTEAPLP